VTPVSGFGATGLAVSWPGKNPPHTFMYPGEICSSIAGMDSARATGLASGNAARISGNPRKWSAWGWVMYTHPGVAEQFQVAIRVSAAAALGCAAARQEDFRADLARISVPVLIMQGGQDKI